MLPDRHDWTAFLPQSVEKAEYSNVLVLSRHKSPDILGRCFPSQEEVLDDIR
jgi:hypothetical protein